jgi:hypothetical protein
LQCSAHHVPNSYLTIPYNSVFCFSLSYLNTCIHPIPGVGWVGVLTASIPEDWS